MIFREYLTDTQGTGVSSDLVRNFQLLGMTYKALHTWVSVWREISFPASNFIFWQFSKLTTLLLTPFFHDLECPSLPLISATPLGHCSSKKISIASSTHMLTLRGRLSVPTPAAPAPRTHLGHGTGHTTEMTCLRGYLSHCRPKPSKEEI